MDKRFLDGSQIPAPILQTVEKYLQMNLLTLVAAAKKCGRGFFLITGSIAEFQTIETIKPPSYINAERVRRFVLARLGGDNLLEAVSEYDDNINVLVFLVVRFDMKTPTRNQNNDVVTQVLTIPIVKTGLAFFDSLDKLEKLVEEFPPSMTPEKTMAMKSIINLRNITNPVYHAPSLLISTCSMCQGAVPKMKQCSACRSVLYCSPECQKRDWSDHKKKCQEMRGMRKDLKKYSSD